MFLSLRHITADVGKCFVWLEVINERAESWKVKVKGRLYNEWKLVCLKREVSEVQSGGSKYTDWKVLCESPAGECYVHRVEGLLYNMF